MSSRLRSLEEATINLDGMRFIPGKTFELLAASRIPKLLLLMI